LPKTVVRPTISGGHDSNLYVQRAEHGQADERRGLGRVIFLGTGDPLNEERAQTSIALPLEGGETMLFDASSGTIVLRQLEAASIPLESVRHLFISHRHFDHAGGLAPLLTAMVSFPKASITVHALPQTLKALRELLALVIPGVEGWLGERLDWSELAPGKPILVHYGQVTPFTVDHGLECAGFRIEQDSSAAVFASDTRPCPSVVEHARGADLLVHEAYALDGEAERAHTLGHSTSAEAGKVARAAGVGRLVLTHFRASRFADPQELVAEARAMFGGSVEAARDLDAFGF
jgi:ribonuclease BN (tRNA processing enzyme)